MDATDEFLRAMGVDRSRLPSREDWIGGPNRVMPKSGFRFIKRYRTVPGPINFQQGVNRYVRVFGDRDDR